MERLVYRLEIETLSPFFSANCPHCYPFSVVKLLTFDTVIIAHFTWFVKQKLSQIYPHFVTVFQQYSIIVLIVDRG